MAIAVRRRWLQLETQGLATYTRGRYDVQLGLHLRDALELYVEGRAEVGDLQRLRLQLGVELLEGCHYFPDLVFNEAGSCFYGVADRLSAQESSVSITVQLSGSCPKSHTPTGHRDEEED